MVRSLFPADLSSLTFLNLILLLQSIDLWYIHLWYPHWLFFSIHLAMRSVLSDYNTISLPCNGLNRYQCRDPSIIFCHRAIYFFYLDENFLFSIPLLCVKQNSFFPPPSIHLNLKRIKLNGFLLLNRVKLLVNFI